MGKTGAKDKGSRSLVEIEPLDTGDARLKLRDGTLVGCSRTYRDALRATGIPAHPPMPPLSAERPG
jgi:hypothetical protein